jgi:hypothetical protein
MLMAVPELLSLNHRSIVVPASLSLNRRSIVVLASVSLDHVLMVVPEQALMLAVCRYSVSRKIMILVSRDC